MKKIVVLLALAVCSVLSAREFEYALVKAEKSPEFRANNYKRTLAKFPANTPVIDVDLLAKPEELKKYKRIFIYDVPRIFTVEQLSGMEKYVSEGGLLVTCSIISDIDTNGDGKGDFSLIARVKKRKAGHPRPNDFPPTGVMAHSAADIKSITAKMECPLSVGFKVNEAMPRNMHFRAVTLKNGIVVMSAEAVLKNKKVEKQMPLIAICNRDKGSFVFMPFEKDFIKNALSAQTIDWLTDQDSTDAGAR